jgi:hypothetical protein
VVILAVDALHVDILIAVPRIDADKSVFETMSSALISGALRIDILAVDILAVDIDIAVIDNDDIDAVDILQVEIFAIVEICRLPSYIMFAVPLVENLIGAGETEVPAFIYSSLPDLNKDAGGNVKLSLLTRFVKSVELVPVFKLKQSNVLADIFPE